MSKKVGSITSWSGGISDSEKEGLPNSFDFGRSIDTRTDATKITILSRASKESGSTVIDLIKWAERIGTDTYFFGDDGNLYKRTSAAVWTKEHTATDASGNGLVYYGEDNYLYYMQDETFGRYGPIGATDAAWYDNFLGAEGGDPTNTHCLDLEAGSSQYGYRADTASLSITGDMTPQVYFKPESLPTTGNTMTLISKWDESGTTRSYKLDIATASDFFGDGSDGALTIAVDTPEAPIDSACSGTVDTKALTATNVSFAAGQKILIHQTRGTNSGVYQLTEIEAYTAGTITTVDTLDISYSSTGSSKAQVRVMKQYTNVTINATKTYTAKAWNGTVGGILGFYANGTVTVNGTITASEKGFRGPDGSVNTEGTQGEGTVGAGTVRLLANNGSGGGGTQYGFDDHAGRPGGGAHATGEGGAGYYAATFNVGMGASGAASGDANLAVMTFGGAGASGGGGMASAAGGDGGNGGGILALFGATFTMGAAGTLSCSGEQGSISDTPNTPWHSDGAGGAGGSILLKADVATLGTSLVKASLGLGSTAHPGADYGGLPGTVGRMHLDYYTSYTGTTTDPVITVSQDDTLSSGDGYTLRWTVSSDGDDSDAMAWDITEDIEIGTYARWAIAWDASAATTYFYKNGILLGQKTGTLTSIHDNASEFFIGCNKDGSGDAENFLDGLVDDVRIYNDIRTATELARHNDDVMYGTEPNQIAYYKFDNDATDSQTDGLNDLTLSGTPVYSTDVPFSGVTSRADEDQELETSGNTYTTPTTISEAATARQTFVPAKDPQKSVEVNIAVVGTGDWTMTVHDALEREIAAVTVENAELYTGDYDFIFASVWRPVIGASYHFHVTSTVADGTVVTTDNADLETADFHTYYQFLVDDEYHPSIQMLNFIAIGNERYVAKWAGLTSANYDSMEITLPSDFRVRCFAFWREYLAIGTWKGTNIYDYDEGRIFFWDGISNTYNFFIDVPEGGINAMLGSKGILYIWAGYSGDMLAYQGGTMAEKIKRIPKIKNDKYTEVSPGAVTMWKSLVRYGAALNTDSTDMEQGAYSYGSLNLNYPSVLTYDYPTSTGVRKNVDLKIGMVKAVGQDLLIGWEYLNSWGVDKVAVSNNPYETATIETLITDLGILPKRKYPKYARADFKKLILGESIKIKYKADREVEWQENDAEDSTNATNTRMRIPANVKEIQLAVDLKTTVSTTPTVTAISLETETPTESRNV